MASNAKLIVCATAVLLGIVSTAEALPFEKYVSSDGDLSELPGLKCLPECAVSELYVVDPTWLTLGTNPSAASLHADVPPPWNDSKGVANSSKASLNADIPPPWAKWLGAISVPSQNSNTIGLPDVANSSNESVSSSPTSNPPVGFLDIEASDGDFLADLINSSVAELDLGSANQSGSESATSAVTGTTGAAVPDGSVAVIPDTSIPQVADPFVPSSSNSVPEPASVTLIGLGLILQRGFAKSRIAKSIRRQAL